MLEILPGQASDASRPGPMLAATVAEVGPVEELVAGRGFDGDAQGEACLEAGVLPLIPNKVYRVDPWPFDPRPYRERNAASGWWARRSRSGRWPPGMAN